MQSPLTNNMIEYWLRESGFYIEKTAPNRWQVKMHHNFCNYVVFITNKNGWFSYGADLMGIAIRNNVDIFYNHILKLNAKLNGAHISIDNNRLVLIRDDFSEDINKYSMYRNLKLFHETHQYVYQEMLKEAGRLCVQILNN